MNNLSQKLIITGLLLCRIGFIWGELARTVKPEEAEEAQEVNKKLSPDARLLALASIVFGASTGKAIERALEEGADIDVQDQD